MHRFTGTLLHPPLKRECGKKERPSLPNVVRARREVYRSILDNAKVRYGVLHVITYQTTSARCLVVHSSSRERNSRLMLRW